MQHIAGFTDEEIARNMRLNPKTVRRLLTRAGVDVAQVVSKREERNFCMGKEWKLSAEAWVEEQIEKKARNGEIHRYAEKRGLSYGDAMIELADKEWKPFQEIRSKNKSKPTTLDEEALDKKAAAYADRHGVSYTVALDALIGTTPGAQRSVELEAPLPVDDTDAAMNRRAESYAKRHNCTYEVALTAVLEDA